MSVGSIGSEHQSADSGPGRRAPRGGRRAVLAGLLAASLLAVLLVAFRFRLDPDVAGLLPARGEAAALRQFLRAFGGTDLATVLVEADDAASARAAADETASRLRDEPSVRFAVSSIDTQATLDPLLAWRHADAATRRRLAEALTDEGMRARLRESRAMLLAPAAGSAAELIARDPLRLGQILGEGSALRSSVLARADGSFSSEDGRARLVLVRPVGAALRGRDAAGFVSEAKTTLEAVARDHPGTHLGLTGGHAIAAATERMLVRDLSLSGSLALVLAALAFALTFPRIRALAAVLPPLVLGTLWTASLAALWPTGLSAIAVAFMSVVVGVGVDTGVHVYHALLEARRSGLGPRAAAEHARRRTARPVLVAALTAAVAFGSLALSEIEALRQLGLLCAAGELLTAIAIVVVTPEIGAWLERHEPPPPPAARWVRPIGWLSATRGRAWVVVLLAALPVALVAFGLRPEPSDTLVAVRPSHLEPLEVEQRIFDRFGGRAGQWVVLVTDPDEEQARARADRIAERLVAMADDVDRVDSISALVPARSTQHERLAERDALDLPTRAVALEAALRDVGFAPERFSDVLGAMRNPPSDLVDPSTLDEGGGAILASRFHAVDGDRHVVAVYVLPKRDPASEGRVEAAIHAIDSRAAITGYSRLDRAIAASLRRDLPRIALVAAALVLVALALAMRRTAHVIIALSVVVSEIAIVLGAIRLLSIPLHVYDALVLPVLLGITVDEGMFLLHRAQHGALDPSRRGRDPIVDTLRDEGPPIAATALTTAAGFGALAFCQFDGLRHLGWVGALGSSVGLLVALVLVPAGLRLLRAAR